VAVGPTTYHEATVTAGGQVIGQHSGAGVETTVEAAP
jgi:hypothetical protein